MNHAILENFARKAESHGIVIYDVVASTLKVEDRHEPDST